MNTPARCKCGRFASREACPDCRADKAKEDKTVNFLIGNVIRPVVEPVKMPREAVIVWAE